MPNVYEENNINYLVVPIFEKTEKLLTNKNQILKTVDYIMEHKEIDEEQFIKIFNKKK